jgi:histidyl-tRNA synthetase
MSSVIQPLKGTRDFYPQEMAVRTWLYRNMRQVSESYGYQEYDGPFLESIELYAAKSGEELVKEQSFVFSDRSGDLITLRPELTPSLARMVAQKQPEMLFPLRWWSFGPFWRYERPQKGRTREFFQWNVDLIGMDTPEADAELVAVIASFFRQVNLSPEEALILVNNRRLVDSQIQALQISPDKRLDVTHWIDKRDKMNHGEWESYGREVGLDTKQLDGLQSILKNEELWQQSEELVRFFEAIKALGVEEYVRYDPSIIRGLDYYTGTVFEAQQVGGELRRAILGGGRYDHLLSDVGGEPLAGVGFAMGDVVITLILEEAGLIPEGLSQIPSPVMVTIFDEDGLRTSFSLASELRRAGLKAACYPEPTRLGKQFSYADRMGARLVVVLGPDEIAADQVTVKNLKSGEQSTLPQSEMVDFIQKALDMDNSS